MTPTAPVSEAIDLSLVASWRPTVTTVELDGETVAYDEATGRVHHLNRQATLVWRFLDGETQLAELAADLADAFQVDPGVMGQNVLALATQLVEEGLLVGLGPEPGPAPGESSPRFLPEPPSP